MVKREFRFDKTKLAVLPNLIESIPGDWAFIEGQVCNCLDKIREEVIIGNVWRYSREYPGSHAPGYGHTHIEWTYCPEFIISNLTCAVAKDKKTAGEIKLVDPVLIPPTLENVCGIVFNNAGAFDARETLNEYKKVVIESLDRRLRLVTLCAGSGYGVIVRGRGGAGFPSGLKGLPDIHTSPEYIEILPEFPGGGRVVIGYHEEIGGDATRVTPIIQKLQKSLNLIEIKD